MTPTPLRLQSFGQKLALAVMLTSGVAVAAVAGLLAIANYLDVRSEAISTARSQAGMLALNSGPALVFGDRDFGNETLAPLRAVPEVAAAALYEIDGSPFASFEREVGSGLLPDRPGDGVWQEGRWLYISRPVFDRGDRQGRLVYVYDLSRVRRRLGVGLAIALAMAAGAMAVSYLVGRRVQRGLAAPIQELVRVTTAVSESHDYSMRAQRLSDDELGQLTDALNEMLARIEEQERELQVSHEERGHLLESERAARSEAERANRMKDDFVATLSHELRTPLMPILAWVGVLRHGGAGEDARTREGLDVIERNVQTQAQMIDDLLDMSRISSGKVTLEVKRVDLVEVVESAIATVRPTAEARGIQLEARLDPRVTSLRVDPDRLQQVVWNLLSNAIKFSDRGGRVTVSLRQTSEDVEIEVSDTGAGIPEDFLPHIFDRFRQRDSSMARRHGGLGLGLAIVRQLVELHGGSVRAESEGEGKGATFVVSLPVTVVEGEETTLRFSDRERRRLQLEDLPSLERLRVLVVDDDQDARDLLSRILQQVGAAVEVAESAAEALTRLEERRPDVLISDIGMPVKDGYELIREIRRLPAEAGGRTPAIALTAFARTEDRTRALRAGYQLHVAKPVEFAELVTAVASVARRAAANA